MRAIDKPHVTRQQVWPQPLHLAGRWSAEHGVRGEAWNDAKGVEPTDSKADAKASGSELRREEQRTCWRAYANACSVQSPRDGKRMCEKGSTCVQFV